MSDNNQTLSEAIIDERGIGNKKIPGHIIVNANSSEKAKWYVVHSTSGHEVRVSQTLKQRIESMGMVDHVFEILVPTQDKVVVRGGKKATIKEKIFPGYILVKMDLTDESWLAVRTTPGITGFVGIGDQPTPLSQTEVGNIMKFTAAPAPRYKTKLTIGDAVKINDGPFTDFLGSVSKIDDARGRVEVLVSIFGRETPVDLDVLQVTKV
jgi:transcription termination/antitermination protein NusG